MLQQNHGDIDNIWKIVKQVRKKFLTVIVDTECQDIVNQIASENVKAIIDDVQKYLTINAMDYDSHENATENILQWLFS